MEKFLSGESCSKPAFLYQGRQVLIQIPASSLMKELTLQTCEQKFKININNYENKQKKNPLTKIRLRQRKWMNL